MNKTRLLALSALLIFTVGFFWYFADFGQRFYAYFPYMIYEVATMFAGLCLGIFALIFSLRQ